MSRTTRFGIGILVVVALLASAAWFDGAVLFSAQREAETNFDYAALALLQALGSLLSAGTALAVGLAGWRFRSAALGVVYVLVGAFFTLLDWIAFRLAAEINGVPPVLPEPVASVVSQVYFWARGPVGLAMIVGAAMLLIGLVMLVATIGRPSFAGFKATVRAPSTGEGTTVHP